MEATDTARPFPASTRLPDPIDLRVGVESGRIVTRAFIGSRELDLRDGLLDAILALAQGQSLSALHVADLGRHGVLAKSSPPVAAPSELMLRPDVEVSLHLATASLALPTPNGPRRITVRPRRPFFPSSFVPPYRLGPIVELAERVQRAWWALSSDASARRKTLDPEQATRLLARLVRDSVTSSHGLMSVLDPEPGGARLLPLVPLHEETPQYAVRAVSFRRGASQRRSLTVDVPQPAALQELGRVLGALGAGIHGSALKEMVGASAFARELVLRLMVEGMLSVPTAPLLVEGGEVVAAPSGSLLARLGQTLLWIDPTGAPRDSVRPDAVLLTTLSTRQIDLETLVRIDKAARIYLPRAGRLSRQVATWLRALGFDAIVELSVEQGGALDADGWLRRESWGWRLGHRAANSALLTGNATAPGAPAAAVFARRAAPLRPRIERGWGWLLDDPARWLDPAPIGTPAQTLATSLENLGAESAFWLPARARNGTPGDLTLDDPIYHDLRSALLGPSQQTGATVFAEGRRFAMEG